MQRLAGTTERLACTTERSACTTARFGMHDGALSMHSLSRSRHDLSMSKDDSSMSKDDVSMSKHDAALSMHDGALSMHDAALSMHDGALSMHDAALSKHDAALSMHDRALGMHDGAAQHARRSATQAQLIDEHARSTVRRERLPHRVSVSHIAPPPPAGRGALRAEPASRPDLRGRQLRAGFPERPANFPWSVILCGMRDVRDYKLASGGTRRGSARRARST